jgi:crotonobetainyl-CoA:carnitine CoA-transferase CaiB-like acyl-CoA transferase
MLGGLRVLEVSRTLSADYCGRLLADFGADVLKVEPPDGSPLRREGPFAVGGRGPDRSLLFWHLNLAKRAMTLDHETDVGRRYFERLVDRADVLLTDGGLGCDALRRERPRLVTASVTGFGEAGPYHDRPGSELLYQALSGSMAATGRQGREPLAGAGRRGEYAAGVFAYVGILAALFARETDGMGQHVETSVFESLAAMGQCFTTLFEYNGYVFHRDEPTFYPYACYPTADGYVSFCLTRVANWPRFVEMASTAALADPRFATPSGRVAHRRDFDVAMTEWLRSRTAREVEALCQENQFGVVRVLTVQDLLEDEHLRVRQFWRPIEVAGHGSIPFTGLPFRMAAASTGPRRGAPRLGEHTASVLEQECGLAADEIPALRTSRVI